MLRHALGVWHTRHQHYQDLARRADNVSHTLLKRAAWKQYRLAFFANRRKRWQEDMKQRLGHIRNKIETRMMTDAFLVSPPVPPLLIRSDLHYSSGIVVIKLTSQIDATDLVSSAGPFSHGRFVSHMLTQFRRLPTE